MKEFLMPLASAGDLRIRQAMERWRARRHVARINEAFGDLRGWIEQTKRKAEQKMVVTKPWQQNKQNQVNVKILKIRSQATKPLFHRPQTR